MIEIALEMVGGIRRSTEAASFYRLLRDQDYDSALEAAERMVSDYPDESLGYRLRAHVRWELEEYVESRDDYTRVIDMDVPISDCLSSRGQVQAELGEWDRALADLNQAVDIARPAGQTIVLAYALNGRSLTLAGLGTDQESEGDFGESVSLCPTNPWVCYHQGTRMFHLNEMNEARVLLELAFEFDTLRYRNECNSELVRRYRNLSASKVRFAQTEAESCRYDGLLVPSAWAARRTGSPTYQ